MQYFKDFQRTRPIGILLRKVFSAWMWILPLISFQQGYATCGGVIRNQHGQWILGFRWELGRVSTILAELLALKTDLEVCKLQNFQKINLFSDSLDAANMIFRNCCANSIIKNVVTITWELIYRDWEVTIKQTPTDNLRCADYIARTTHGVGINTKLLWSCPTGCLDLMLFDMSTS